MCSPPRKSLVKGERFIRFEGKPEWIVKTDKKQAGRSDRFICYREPKSLTTDYWFNSLLCCTHFSRYLLTFHFIFIISEWDVGPCVPFTSVRWMRLTLRLRLRRTIVWTSVNLTFSTASRRALQSLGVARWFVHPPRLEPPRAACSVCLTPRRLTI